MNNHNSHVVPGYYNPQVQDKTGIGDIYPDVFDPTQVPMTPGDTAIPMRREHPEMVAAPPTPPSAASPSPANPSPISSSTTNPVSVSSRYRVSEEGVVIPIVIEVTINVRVNHG